MLTCPHDVSVDALPGTNYATVSQSTHIPTATDNSKEPVTINMTDATTFLVGTHLIEVNATDHSGNLASCNFTITVLDRQPPTTVNCPGNMVVQSGADGSAWVATYDPPTFTDNNGTASVVTNHPKGSSFAVGTTTTVTFNATDYSGNVAVCRFTVTVLAPTTSAGAAASSSSQSLSTGSIAGLSVGLAIAAIVIVVLFIAVRKLKYKSKQPFNFEALLASLHEVSVDSADIPDELDRDRVAILELLGSGNFGSVHKALYSEKHKGSSYLVAVKCLHASQDSSKTELLHEAAVMAQFHSPRVVQLIGVVTVGEPVMMLVEFCELGPLSKYLQDHDIDLKQQLRFGGDCAEGMSYLASRGFVHRDIAARNILIASDKRCKISDFGLSRETGNSEYYRSRGGQIPVRWTAPGM